MIRTCALLLNAGRADEQTVTALQLVERLLERDVTVRVFAHDEAAILTAGTHPVARAVSGLIHKSVQHGSLQWLVEGDATAPLGVADSQVRGVIDGDHADMWHVIRESDLVLSVGVGA